MEVMISIQDGTAGSTDRLGLNLSQQWVSSPCVLIHPGSPLFQSFSYVYLIFNSLHQSSLFVANFLKVLTVFWKKRYKEKKKKKKDDNANLQTCESARMKDRR